MNAATFPRTLKVPKVDRDEHWNASKPRLRRSLPPENGTSRAFWVCVGLRCYGVGLTPRAAFDDWQPRAAVIAGVQGEEPVRELPPIKPQQLTKGA